MGSPHLVFAAAGRQCVRESSALNCMENVGRRVRLLQLTLRTVSADRRADRRQFCIHRVVVVDCAVAGSRDLLSLRLAQHDTNTGWTSLGWTVTELGPWKAC